MQDQRRAGMSLQSTTASQGHLHQPALPCPKHQHQAVVGLSPRSPRLKPAHGAQEKPSPLQHNPSGQRWKTQRQTQQKIGKSGKGLRINAKARLPGKMLKALAMAIEPLLGIFVFPALFDGQRS